MKKLLKKIATPFLMIWAILYLIFCWGKDE